MLNGLDLIDWRLLALLQQDARITNLELAQKVELSPSPCLNRVRALEESGVISRYVTLLDPLALGLTVSVFIQVRLERQVESALEKFEAAVRERPEVMECYLMTGDADYLLRVVVPDVPALERFIVDVHKDNAHIGVALKRQLTGGQFIQHHPQGINIGADINFPAARALLA